jgi:DNA-binding response OmpR family regulator
LQDRALLLRVRHMSEAAKRVLVVDDRQDIVGFVCAELERAGYAVECAGNGRQALERQRERAADLMLVDIFMPEMDGIETIHSVRTQYPQTRIVAMSSGVHGMQDYLKVARDIGADATLAKPFGVDELLHVIRTVL